MLRNYTVGLAPLIGNRGLPKCDIQAGKSLLSSEENI